MSPAEPEASLRENLRQEIAAAQSNLAVHIAELRQAAGDTGLLSQADAQLGALSALQQQIETASPLAMAMMRATIAASVTAANNLAQQAANATAANTQSAAAAALAMATAEARKTVREFERDMFERKIFDPYLQFKSPEDEAAYRAREAERKAAIDKAMAKDTPKGALDANQLSIDQLKDAGAHGADRSPDFQKMMNDLNRSNEGLNQSIAVQKAVTPLTPDPLDAVTAATDVHPELIASLRRAGVRTSPDHEQVTPPDARTSGGSLSPS